MRKTIVAATLGLAAFSVASQARAAGWGLHSGDTLGRGDNMLYGELGWPDVAIGFQHGVTSRVDVGFRFGLTYGFDYTTRDQAGMTMRVPIRLSLAKNERFSILVHFDPGLEFASFGDQNPRFTNYNDGLAFGLALGIGAEAGFHVNREVTVVFGFEMPVYLNMTGGVYSAVPLLFGPGFDYQIDAHMALGVDARFGPTLFDKSDIRADAVFGLVTQAYFAYRL